MADRSRDSLPPLGETGVEPVAGDLSWFAGTIRPDGPEEAIGWWLREVLMKGPESVGQSLLATPRYRSGVRADDRSWSVGWEGAGDAAGTVFVEATQTHLERLQTAGSVGLALRLLAAGVRPSRVDLVGVADGERLDLATLWAAWRGGRARTRVRGGRRVEDFDGRQGLYVGSRAGERFGRLYEPKGWQPWPVRLEVELKGGHAQAVGADLLDGRDVGDLWADELRGMIDFPTVAAWGALFG
jgi:hypothetical protein